MGYISRRGNSQEARGINLKWDQINLFMKTVAQSTRKREGSNLETDIIPLTQALTEKLSWWKGIPGDVLRFQPIQ